MTFLFKGIFVPKVVVVKLQPIPKITSDSSKKLRTALEWERLPEPKYRG